MHAVIRSQGKQFRVAPGTVLEMPSMEGEVGQSVTFGEVLSVESEKGATVGTPRVDGASVTATIVAQGRGPKILTWKHLRRKNHKKKIGHRQGYTRVRIEKVEG